MPTLAGVLTILEQHYGPQQPTFPTDPYDFLIWWHCDYARHRRLLQTICGPILIRS